MKREIFILVVHPVCHPGLPEDLFHMISEKAQAIHGEMLETIETGELRNELVDILLFSSTCAPAMLKGVAVVRCQEQCMKISHLPEARSKM